MQTKNMNNIPNSDISNSYLEMSIDNEKEKSAEKIEENLDLVMKTDD